MKNDKIRKLEIAVVLLFVFFALLIMIGRRFLNKEEEPPQEIIEENASLEASAEDTEKTLADTAKAEDSDSDAPRLEDMPDVVRQAQADYERNQQSTES